MRVYCYVSSPLKHNRTCLLRVGHLYVDGLTVTSICNSMVHVTRDVMLYRIQARVVVPFFVETYTIPSGVCCKVCT